MQQNQISLETGRYFKDLLTISAVLMVLKCKLSFQLVKVEVKIVSAHSTLNVNFNNCLNHLSVQLREGGAFVLRPSEQY